MSIGISLPRILDKQKMLLSISIVAAVFKLVIVTASEPCSIPLVSNGEIGRWIRQSHSRYQKYEKIPVGEMVKSDEKLFLHCENGYKPLDSNTDWQVLVICKDGKWSEDPYCNLSICNSEPPEAANGRVENMDRSHDGRVFYECLPDFKKVQSGNVYCNMGEWNGVPPICKDTRCHAEDLKDLTGVADIRYITKSGDELKVHCREGYKVRPNLPKCLDGEWKMDDQSPCEESDCSVPWILYGHIEEKIVGPKKYIWWKLKCETPITYKEVSVGLFRSRSHTLYLVCQEGFSIHGTGTSRKQIMCSEGRWSPDTACLINGINYTSTEASRSTIDFTTTSTRPPYSRTTSESATTGSTVIPVDQDEKNSNHSEDACTCEYLSGKNIVAHANGKEVKLHDRVKNGTVLMIRCETVGYHRLVGPREVLCDNCRPWNTIDFPICVIPEPGDTIIFFDDINVSLDGVLEVQKGQSLRMTCTAVETAKFPKWRLPIVAGIIVNEKVALPTKDILFLSHLDIENITSKYNGFYACAVNRGLFTVVQLQVVDPDARCPRFSLEDKDFAVEYDGTHIRTGSIATFSCQKNGQKLNGPSVATCLRTGEWSSPPPQCITPGCLMKDLIETTPLNLLPDTEGVTEELQPIGSELPLMCQQDTLLIGGKKATCGPLGQWDFGEAQCVDGCTIDAHVISPVLIIEPVQDYYTFGDTIILSCPLGQELTSNEELVMCMGTVWSADEFPECRAKKNNP